MTPQNKLLAEKERLKKDIEESNEKYPEGVLEQCQNCFKIAEIVRKQEALDQFQKDISLFKEKAESVESKYAETEITEYSKGYSLGWKSACKTIREWLEEAENG